MPYRLYTAELFQHLNPNWRRGETKGNIGIDLWIRNKILNSIVICKLLISGAKIIQWPISCLGFYVMCISYDFAAVGKWWGLRLHFIATMPQTLHFNENGYRDDLLSYWSVFFSPCIAPNSCKTNNIDFDLPTNTLHVLLPRDETM